MIAVIDYGAGNLYSVAKALIKVGATDVVVTGDKHIIKKADRLILPGVGAFSHCMNVLRKSDLIENIEDAIFLKKKPLLAICVGLQLMANQGYEHGVSKGLGWLDAEVLPLAKYLPVASSLRIPHTGWDQIFFTKLSPIFEGIPDGSFFYFNHSYFLQSADNKNVIAQCHYGIPFTSAVMFGNIFACQFHPEKSQANGLRMLKNFCTWEPI